MADLAFATATNMKFDSADIAVTSSELDVIPAVASAHAIKCDSLSITNVHASNTDTVTVKRYIGATGREVVKTLSIPAGVTVVVISKNNPKRLNEGDKITVQGAAASGNLVCSADWEDHY